VTRRPRSGYGLAATLASAVLLAAADTSAALWPLAGVALVPWLSATRRASPLRAIGLGVLMGTLFGCCAAPWIPRALRTLGASPASATLGLVAVALWAKGPAFAAGGVLARALRRAPAAIQVLGTATAFGAGERLAASGYGGVPAALIGHSQLPAAGVAQLAVVGGVPLISAWLVAVNAALALAAARRAPVLAAALTASWLGTAIAGVPWAMALRPAPPARSATTLLLVQPDIARRARWDVHAQPWILETAIAQTSEALARAPVDAIAWPENLLTTPLEADPRLAASLARAVDEWNTPLVTGLVRRDEDGDPHLYRSSVVWLEPRRGVVAAIDKARAVPLLESSAATAGDAWLAPLLGAAARGPKVREASNASGPSGSHFPVSVALCYEALFPGIVDARRTPGSLAILNPADDSWMQVRAATRQLLHWAAFRAVEQRLPLVRVAHGGGSAVADPYGRIIARLPEGRAATLRVTLHPSPPPTSAERVGVLALPGAILALTGAVGGILSRRRATPGSAG